MKRLESTLIWGILLVAAGLLFLLQNLGVFGRGADILWAFVFGVGGLAFLYVFLNNRTQWWAVIPGFSLLGLATLMFVQGISPCLGSAIGGSLFLGAIGLSFWVVYFLDRKNWWAVIPGGVLLTLALVAGAGPVFGGEAGGWLFFLGLGATFALVAILPTPEGRMKWAWFPALGCLAMAFFLMAQATEALRYLWPLALVAGGAYLLYRTMISKGRD